MGLESFFKKLTRRSPKEGQASYLGAAKELEKKKEILPATEVENIVLYANPDFPELPFVLKEGEPTKLGLFLTPDGPGFPLETRGGHGRSGILGRLIFKDREGRIYRDVDLKGVGYSGERKVKQPIPDLAGRHSLGILNVVDAYKDQASSEDFLKKGIRTHRVIGIVGLKEIVDAKGQKISIEKAKEKNLIIEKDKPVISIRAYGTKMRVDDLEFDLLKRSPVFEDVRLLVCQEFGFDPENFHEKEYLQWFIETTAKQVALMHKNGWFHGYLTPHNITLDARITDLDSVGWLKHLSEEEANRKIQEDITDAEIACRGLIDRMQEWEAWRGRFMEEDVFEKAYDAAYKD